MTLPKLLALLIFLIFAGIAIAGWFKSGNHNHDSVVVTSAGAVELAYVSNEPPPPPPKATPIPQEIKPSVESKSVQTIHPEKALSPEPPMVDRVDELFSTTGKKLPIVETITYKSHVQWNKGRLAWLADYASHYKTSRHFLARSRNGKSDYYKQDLAEGDRINILKPDMHLQFHMVIDTSRNKMWLYYIDVDKGDRQIIKTYNVGLGRPDPNTESGILTPLGAFILGDKAITIDPGKTGIHNGSKVELIRVFGTRWIPFSSELGDTSLPAKGFGIHGVPWKENEYGKLAEDSSSIGKYESDGCIRLATKDAEEIYAIIITKPSVVEIVRDFHEARFPIADAVFSMK